MPLNPRRSTTSALDWSVGTLPAAAQMTWPTGRLVTRRWSTVTSNESWVAKTSSPA